MISKSHSEFIRAHPIINTIPFIIALHCMEIYQTYDFVGSIILLETCFQNIL